MNEIKSISRSWLYPNERGGVYTDECYSVGTLGVKKISVNALGSFNVEFETGEIISVVDVQYVEYFTQEKNIYKNTECLRHKCTGCEKCFPNFETDFSTGDRPEFPKDRTC